MISVIMPAYNRAHIMEIAIESALSQDYSNLEIMIVDDGSTDNTEKLMADKYGSNPKVRYLKKKNGGCSSARNLAMRECKGDFVAFLDTDDAWLPGKLKAQVGALELFPDAGLIWTEMCAINGARKVVYETYLRESYSAYRFFPNKDDLFSKRAKLPGTDISVYYSEDIYSGMVLGNLVHTSTVMTSRERMLKAGEFNEKYKVSGDYHYHLKTSKSGPVAYVDHVFLQYMIGEADQLTAPSFTLRHALTFLEILEESIHTNPERIKVPKKMIADCYNEALAWVGRGYLGTGDFPKAKEFLFKSLKRNPMQLQQWKAVVKSYLKMT